MESLFVQSVVLTTMRGESLQETLRKVAEPLRAKAMAAAAPSGQSQLAVQLYEFMFRVLQKDNKELDEAVRKAIEKKLPASVNANLFCI